jgi:hypothetical protein
MKPIVLIESPYKGATELHIEYLRECFRDSIRQGEVPLATHKLYTDVLDDNVEQERTLGMSMLDELIDQTAYSVIYYDLGISAGMKWGIDRAISLSKPLRFRSLYGHPIPKGIT